MNISGQRIVVLGGTSGIGRAVARAAAETGARVASRAREALQIGPLTAMDGARARAFFDVRYWGARVAAKHAAPRVREGGSIVLTAGTGGDARNGVGPSQPASARRSRA